jgi:hypothetical protein
VLAIGVDLFFNAGLFAGLFDQGREPALLADEALFARVPIAYLLLLLGVLALAWLVDRVEVQGGREGLRLGAAMGLIVAALGTMYLWTAIDLTVPFVGAGVLVQVTQFAASGAALGNTRVGGRQRWVVGVGMLLVVGGVVLQNVL